MKPVLVGEAPSRVSDVYFAFPLWRSAEKLCRAAGIPPATTSSGAYGVALYRLFECYNLFERYADAQPWSTPRARARAASVLEDLARLHGPPGALVALGRRVEEAVMGALGVPAPDRPDYHEWVAIDGFYFVSTPHPSGRNRLLNDEDERRDLGRTLVDAITLAAAL